MANKFYLLHAEVVGYPGKNCKPAQSADSFTHLDYELDDMPHDCLFGCLFEYVIVESMAVELVNSGFTGAEFKDMEISFTEEYEEHTNYIENKVLPSYKWLKATGQPGKDDFGIEREEKPVSGLVVSQAVLDTIYKFGYTWGDTYRYPSGKVYRYGKITESSMGGGSC